MEAPSDPKQLQFVEINLSTGVNRQFFFRSSGTDLSVVKQIFEQQHYSLSTLPLSNKLKTTPIGQRTAEPHSWPSILVRT